MNIWLIVAVLFLARETCRAHLRSNQSNGTANTKEDSLPRMEDDSARLTPISSSKEVQLRLCPSAGWHLCSQ